MPQIKLLILFLTLGSLFIQCKNDNAKDEPNDSKGIDKPEEPKEHYYHLEGTIKGIPITMNLIHRLNEDALEFESPEDYSGSYYYNKYREPIQLSYEANDSTNTIKLNEWTSDDANNSFVGSFETAFSFEGDWHNELRQFSLPFTLKTSYPEGTIALSFQSWDAFQPADSTKEDGTGVSYDFSALWPKDDNTFIKETILKIIAESDDLLGYGATNPGALFEELKSEYFEEYFEMIKDFGDASSHIPAYSNSIDMFVVWNKDSVLVLGANYYMYEGGAHGMFESRYFNLDLKNQKLIRLVDIFEDNYEKPLTNALNNALRRKYDLAPDQSLLDIVDVEEIPISSSFFVTGGGIGFYYPPYELGSWAAGDFQFFVHYDDIESVVKPEFLDRIEY